MQLFLSIIGFLIILGPLVVVHEFGHYIFARIFGVKAEIFSIGFGPKLWSRQMGETELRVSAVPMGGYVKLLGEDRDAELTEEEAKRALHRQPAWKRFFIFFGGPLFNFLFAIVVFMAILLIGERQMASVVGRVVPGTVAARVGFQSGDRIVEVDGKPVHKFEEVMLALNESPDREMSFQVVHPDGVQPVTIRVMTGTQTGFSVYGESTRVGDIEGLISQARSDDAGVSDPASPAGKAGIHTGDQVVAINGKPLSSWEQLEREYAELPGGATAVLKIQKPGSEETRDAKLVKPLQGATDPAKDWGLFSSELFVEKTVPDSPAEKAGVQAGDRLVSVGGTEVRSFFQLKDQVQKSGETEGRVDLKWVRGGKILEKSVVPTATPVQDPLLKKSMQYTVGVMPMLTAAEPPMVVERVWNPFMLLYKGTERMITMTARNFISIGKMFGGSVSVKTLGGPIMIGKLAGESLSRGLISFLTMMGILSIGLGVLNVLPVPVLDGGHLLLLAIESVRGKPLTLRQMEIIQGVGLCLILLLMVLVFKNDISRLPYF